MEDFLRENQDTIAYYVRKYCPNLPYNREYLEAKVRVTLERLCTMDASSLDGLFWPSFSDIYDRQFLEIIEKKGLIAEKCNIELGWDIIPYDGTNDNLYEPDEIRIAYAALPGICFGWLVQETVEDKQYIQKASSIMDDLYKSFREMESYTDDQKLHKLRTLLRYIDSVRGQVKGWPNVPIREELLRHVDEKYETYDELYDEISLRIKLQRK
jgi:hypothetical protein